jgi:hypothetical protein
MASPRVPDLSFFLRAIIEVARRCVWPTPWLLSVDERSENKSLEAKFFTKSEGWTRKGRENVPKGVIIFDENALFSR